MPLDTRVNTHQSKVCLLFNHNFVIHFYPHCDSVLPIFSLLLLPYPPPHPFPTQDYFSALYEQKIAFSTAKARRGGFDSGAHVSDRTTTASTFTTPTTPTNLTHITQPGTIIYHLDAPHGTADYIAALEEELMERTVAKAAESTEEFVAAAITTPVDQTTLFLE